MTGGCGVVIVGAGQAGAEVATGLRHAGFAGRIVLVGEEPHPPYRRPPLSKECLLGPAPPGLLIKPEAAYAKAGIELVTGVRAVAVDRGAAAVHLGDGRVLGYDWLVLATGGRNRPLPLPGADAANVHALRTIEDSQAIDRALVAGRRLVMIGGGYIGLEIAAAAIQRGLAVSLLVRGPRVLARVTGPELSAFYEREHRRAGVDLRTGVEVAGFETEAGRVRAVVLAGGAHLAADVVVVGNGLMPNQELARQAGLAVADGILVDEHARTSDARILAVGDVANHPNRHYGRRMRVESVPNAVRQARTAVATIRGIDLPFDPIPWFWSNQYDLKLQMVGISDGHDRMVMRGDVHTRSFSVFYLRGGTVIAADTVNQMPDFMAAKTLIARGLTVAPEHLADVSAPLGALIDAPPAGREGHPS